MNGNGINQRFIKFVEINKLKKKDIAALLGVSDTRFKQWEDNDRKLSADLIQIICTQFPALNVRWLITGEGEMMGSEVADWIAQDQPQTGSKGCAACEAKDLHIRDLQNQVTLLNSILYSEHQKNGADS